MAFCRIPAAKVSSLSLTSPATSSASASVVPKGDGRVATISSVTVRLSGPRRDIAGMSALLPRLTTLVLRRSPRRRRSAIEKATDSLLARWRRSAIMAAVLGETFGSRWTARSLRTRMGVVLWLQVDGSLIAPGWAR
eukprot:scaffold19867_cov56-Phaeocystis_antarctica.AAC.5